VGVDRCQHHRSIGTPVAAAYGDNILVGAHQAGAADTAESVGGSYDCAPVAFNELPVLRGELLDVRGTEAGDETIGMAQLD